MSFHLFVDLTEKNREQKLHGKEPRPPQQHGRATSGTSKQTENKDKMKVDLSGLNLTFSHDITAHYRKHCLVRQRTLNADLKPPAANGGDGSQSDMMPFNTPFWPHSVHATFTRLCVSSHFVIVFLSPFKSTVSISHLEMHS